MNLDTDTSRTIHGRATIEDVAARANVSTATVSRVINGTGQVSSRTRERVLTAIEALNYVPSGAARNLARGAKKIVGLVVPGTITPYYSSLLRGIDSNIGSNGYSLLVYVNHTRNDAAGYQTPILGEHNTDGLIIFTDSVSDDLIERQYHRGFPMVLLHRSAPNTHPIPVIKLENRIGAYQLVEHLILNGKHKRIAYLRGPANNEDSFERERGYCEALAAHGLIASPDLIGQGEYRASIAERTVTDWLANGLQFDAIFAGDDNAAIGAMTALRAFGKQIPNDVAVVGFNDDDLAQHSSPPLTTVRADTEKIGYLAAQKLLQQISGESPEMLSTLPTQLVIRQSCGSHLIS